MLLSVAPKMMGHNALVDLGWSLFHNPSSDEPVQKPLTDRFLHQASTAGNLPRDQAEEMVAARYSSKGGCWDCCRNGTLPRPDRNGSEHDE
jgi:hypothetical protein